jgi:hypothetical protein
VKGLVRGGAALLFALALAPATLGHFGAEAFIHVPRDHVNPGEEFPVIAADLDPDAQIPLSLIAGTAVVELGSVPTDADGHFETTLVMPSSVPHGYAQIVATSPDMGEVSTWVLIGPREGVGEPPGSPGGAGGSSSPLSDPSVIVLIALVVGALLAVGWVATRRRSAAPPASAPASLRKGSARRPRTGD